MIHARNILEVYPQLLDAIQSDSTMTSPRGQRVSEHTSPIGWCLSRPWEWSLMIPGRRLNPFFALAEVVWMWSGKGGIDFISYYNKSMTQFADEGIPYFHGSYGRRVRKAGYDERPFRELPYLVSPNQNAEKVEIDQLEHVIRKIRNDNDTRQAVVSLWDPVKDNLVSSKDHPCNNMVYFSLRRGLNMTVVIRSNDLIWGTPYNMIQFVHLQALIAGSLGVKMGQFNVLCNNLHYYHDLYPDTLESVLGWRVALGENAVRVDKLCDVTYSDMNAHTMTWSLESFDGFVRNIWEPMEKMLRIGFESNGQGAFYSAQWEKFKMQMGMSTRIPDYWKQVFTVMFMYHIRKAKITDLYNDLLSTLSPNLRWMINDFDSKQE